MTDQYSTVDLDGQALAQALRTQNLPASIRTNNPGAQWMGPVAQQYGATGAVSLPGGNNAASFPDPVSGAAAQFALWGQRYSGMPLSAAISKWSGGNSSPAYANFITKNTGLSGDTVLTRDLLAGPQGMALAKAQAQWEAGRPYPMSDDQWRQAQARAFGGGAGAPGPIVAAASGAPATMPTAPATAPGIPIAASNALPPAQGDHQPGTDFDPQEATAGLLLQQRAAQSQGSEGPDAIEVPQPAMPPLNLARIRNAVAMRGGAGGGPPLPPSVAQRLAQLMGRG